MEPSKPKPRKVRIIDEENNARFQQFVNKIERRFKSGEYDINKTRRANNIQSIQREQTRLTQKRERGEVVNEENVTTLEDLLELIENDNNEGNRSGNSGSNEDENNTNKGNGVENTELGRVPADIINNSKPVAIKQTLTNGDCLYSAIYRGAREREGLLDKLHECLELDIADETVFIRALRNKIADRVASGDLLYSDERNGRVDLYDKLNGLMETDGQYQEVTRNYPDWFIKEFGVSGERLGVRPDFCERLASHIRTPAKWAGEIEVGYVRDMFLPCNIILEIHRDKPSRLQEKNGENDIIHIYNPEEVHYTYFSFMIEAVSALAPVEEAPGTMRIMGEPVDDGTTAKPAEEALGTATIVNPCAELFDPCTREPIANIQALERRVREIKKLGKPLRDTYSRLPSDIKTRLDLLLHIINRDTRPDESLLHYGINATEQGWLYESYWTIVFSLGLIDEFPINNNFYMFNGKIEELSNIDDERFTSNPIEYLQSRNINEGTKSGASDITFVYKKQVQTIGDSDLCSAPSHIIPSMQCSRSAEGSRVGSEVKPNFFFCSSKYYTNDKSVDKYDIQNIYTAAKMLNNMDYSKKIILLVKDKHSVNSTLQRALRKYMADEVAYVFGITDLISALGKFYDYIHGKHQSDEKITKESLMRILNITAHIKPIMQLRLHQHIAVYKITDAINRFKRERTGNNKFLVGIVPRGGKTYIAGGIIDSLNSKRVVVLLGAKSETLTQFKNALFEYFQNFNTYTCIDVVDETDEADIDIDPTKKYIFIMSIELFKTESTRRLVHGLKSGDERHRADLFICDEAHIKMVTKKSQNATNRGTSITEETAIEEQEITEDDENKQLNQVDRAIHRTVPVVYMSGTYVKPLTAFSIPSENTIIWDYQDIQSAKELIMNEMEFKDTFGEFYDRAIQTCITYGQTYESIQLQYRKFPELHLLTTQFTKEAKDAFLLQSPTRGFATLSHLFEVKSEFNPTLDNIGNWYTGFKNPNGLMRLINYIAPSIYNVRTLGDTEIEPIPSVMESIDSIAQRVDDRLGFITSNFVAHTQLWFLPHMQLHPLLKRMCALAGLIFRHPWFRKYFDIIAVSTSVKWPRSSNNSVLIPSGSEPETCGLFSWYDKPCPDKDGNLSLKQCLLNKEREARSRGKGLIILAQNMLHLGISLPCVDIVVLLDTGEKVDERIQKMYRALTESTNKKAGYIVDMNYFRTVTALTHYQLAYNRVRTGRKQVREDIESTFNKILDVYSIDDDKPLLRADISSNTIPELIKEFGRKAPVGNAMRLENAGTALNTNIKSAVADLYKSSYNDFLAKLQEEAIKKVREEGANIKRAKHTSDHDTRHNNTNKTSLTPFLDAPLFPVSVSTDIQKRLAFIELFKTTLKLGAFGTNAHDIRVLEHNLSENEELRNIVYDTLIKRGLIVESTINSTGHKNHIIDNIIRPGIRIMTSKSRGDTYRIMSGKVEDLSTYPKNILNVLTYISEHLTPKEAERHKYGEVFTPMDLVHKMLDTLPPDVWNNKDLKWLDPANGMGNYPIAVFLRLCYGFRTSDGKYIEEGEGEYNPGLTNIIKDEKTRIKHIVKNMLYMVELNPKNITISKRLFSKLADGIEPNIIQMHRKDGFLADVEMKFQNGVVDKFDIIMGNPPFQGGAVRGKTTNKTRKMRIEMDLGQEKHKNLWIPFVKKILSTHLKKDGYLLFIHPIGWFKPDITGIHEEMLKYQIHNITIFFGEQSKIIFKGSGEISTAFYLLQNKPIYTNTEITDINGNIDKIKLNNESIIILAYNGIFEKIQKKVSLFYQGDSHKTNSIKPAKCATGSHPQIHKISEKGDITFIKTSIEHPNQTVPKIILSGYKYPRFFYDKIGEYGLIGNDQHYFIGRGLSKLEDYFKTKLSALLLTNIKYRTKFIEPKYYPDVRTLPLKKITDDTLADYFKFTEEEREIINSTVYPTRKYTFKEITCADLNEKKTKSVLRTTRRRSRK